MEHLELWIGIGGIILALLGFQPQLVWSYTSTPLLTRTTAIS
jgi:hypothetical protein